MAERRPADYADVLADAQALGYAEADPAGDVEGDDAVNKLVILARLAFGRWLDPAERRPAPADRARPGPARDHRASPAGELEAAAALGLTIKLLATAAAGRRRRSRRRSCPTAVPVDGPFGRTDGVPNRIEIDAEPLGTSASRARRRRRGDEQRGPRRPGRGRPRPGSTWAGLPPATDRPSRRRPARRPRPGSRSCRRRPGAGRDGGPAVDLESTRPAIRTDAQPRRGAGRRRRSCRRRRRHALPDR